MSVENPRFPHFCRITRKTTPDPLDEEEDYSPLCSEVEEFGCNGGKSVRVIYEGCCRGYEKNTTSDRGDVITSYRGLSLPVTLNEWQEMGDAPREGDEVAVCKGVYAEYGRVTDVSPANFHGTHLIWRYGRN